MSNLRDNPLIIIISVFASLVAILYTGFVFFTGSHSIQGDASQASNKEPTQISSAPSNSSKIPRNDKSVYIDPKDITSPTRNVSSNENDEISAKNVKETVKTINECNLDGVKFFGEYGYYLKFYAKEENNYKIIADIGISSINGTAFIREEKITIRGNYGTGSLILSKNCRNITGFLGGRTKTHSIDFKSK